ncbi:hypothetical protein ANN_12792 [Periplaneta americana]|uniref:Uncharacterized protein n=1 Tax=Periplaneta americana TaxID=6978 RepID=A0ABQ8TKA0_PERAM|nr:hypothetical protein ANN_12792 [Periplaneta americana]
MQRKVFYRVYGGYCSRGQLKIKTVASRAKVNAVYFQEEVLRPVYLQDILWLYGRDPSNINIHMDKASSHTAKLSLLFYCQMEAETGIKRIPFCGFGLPKRDLSSRREALLNNLKKNEATSSELKAETIHTVYPEKDWLNIYTDGSLYDKEGSAGAGIYCTIFSSYMSAGCNTTHFDGEILAIDMALSQLPGRINIEDLVMLKIRIYKTVILPVLLYGCETWTLTLREEHRLRVFENKVLRKIFGAKRDEVTGEWRKLHNTELHALYSSPDIIRNLKSRRLRWAGHVARMGESRNAYRVLVGRPEGKRPLGRPRRRWEDNIKMDLREVGYDDRDWLNLAQDRDRWRAYVRAAMNLRVP